MEHKDLIKILDNIKDDSLSLDDTPRVLIIDGLNLFYRNFAILNYINHNGVHIGGLGGFLRSLGSLVNQINPTSVQIIFDGVGSTINRKNLLPEYKSGRNTTRVNKYVFDNIEDEDESKSDQISRLIHYLKCLPVNVISLDKVEADDVMALMSIELSKRGSKAFIVSSDKDFFQLIDDNITVYASMEKKFYYSSDLLNRFGVYPYNFLTYRVLTGDSSDKIKGIKGLGGKKLKKLFPELFSDNIVSLEDIFKICEVKYKDHIIYSKIIFEYEQLKINKKVMSLDSPMVDDKEKIYILNMIDTINPNFDIPRFMNLYNEDGLGNILKNVEFWLRNTWLKLHKYNKAKLI